MLFFFRPGSTIVIMVFVTVKATIYEQINTTTVASKNEEATKQLILQITTAVTKAAKTLEEKGVLRGIKVPEDPVKIEKGKLSFFNTLHFLTS